MVNNVPLAEPNYSLASVPLRSARSLRLANYALELAGGPRRAALVLAEARTRSSAADCNYTDSYGRPARSSTLIRYAAGQT